MKTTKLLVCAVAVAAAFAAAQSQGQTINATLIDISPGLNVNGSFNGGAYTLTFPAGVMNFSNFDAFCVQPLESLSYGESLVYEITSPVSLTPTAYNSIARLVGGYLASSQNNQNAAAVQWAIWEVTNETTSPPSLFDGNIRIIGAADQATAALANQYLANVNTYTAANLTYLRNNGRQDVVTWNTVPEPASVGLAALSGMLLLVRRRR